MPYGRRRFNRRRTNRRSTSKKIMGYAAMAVSAYKMAKYLKTLINVETKRKVITAANSLIPNTGTIVLWSNLAQGDLEDQRNGNRVKMRSWNEHYSFLMDSSAEWSTMRIITFIDKASNGVLPGVTDVLDAATYLSHYNNEYSGSRFKIVQDHTIELSDGVSQVKHLKLVTKMHQHLTFNGSASNQAGCYTGHIYTLFISNYPSTFQPAVSYNNTLNYVDN